MHKRIPTPLPRELLSDLARGSGFGLFLDYDGTLAEIVADPAKAFPFPGVPELLDNIADSKLPISIAIVSGRRIREVKRLLGTASGILFSGVHGMEFEDSEGRAVFTPAALECSRELAGVREWLKINVPPGRGFWVEDKDITLGLHYREADPGEARDLVDRFIEFVERAAPRLKVMHLKMLAEAMPRAAGDKGQTIVSLKARLLPSSVAVYFGDDTTDEDAFQALEANDVGVLVGAPRATLARYWVAGPEAVRDELRTLSVLSTAFGGRANPRV